MSTETTTCCREPWNMGKLIGQKAPLKPEDIWAIRVRLQMEHRVRRKTGETGHFVVHLKSGGATGSTGH